MQLMREGDLAAATATIQRNLAAQPEPDREGAPTIMKGLCIDGVGRVIPESANEDLPAQEFGPADPGEAQVSTTGTFSCRHGARDYLMFAPREAGPRPAPLLLMLHGCTQSPGDFARGTRMHVRAAAEGYVVIYPAQGKRHNANACWNWFRSADQQRDQGEPAILTGMVEELARRANCDMNRVYVAGLSAGGAMALNLAHLYPEVFRGVGAHSGLPYGCAHDMPSAMAAMRNGGSPRAGADGERLPRPHVPTIAFHGDRDATVNVRNTTRVVPTDNGTQGQGQDAANDAQWESATTARTSDRYGFTTTRVRDAFGKSIAERWIVHGAGHAWFGGSPAGSYTDPRGPDATSEMLRFFRDLK
jgi:poly(hydroxyalkanoate) depolymerase family esterase